MERTMWEWYQKLTDDMDEETRVEDLVIGPAWAAVRSSTGSVGLAPVIVEPRERFPFSRQPETGMSLKELAQNMVSWNYAEAALAQAAVNAFYNDPGRLPASARHLPGGRRTRKAFPQFCEEHTREGKTVLVEPQEDSDTLSEMPGVMEIIRKETEFRDYIPAAWTERIPPADRLVLSGKTFVEKTAEKMIRLAGESGTGVFLFGTDIPLCPGLQDMGICETWGFVVDDPETVMQLARAGMQRMQYLKLGHFVVLG